MKDSNHPRPRKPFAKGGFSKPREDGAGKPPFKKGPFKKGPFKPRGPGFKMHPKPHFNKSNEQPERKQNSDWSNVAHWYDEHVGREGGEYHREVIFPNLMKLLKPEKGLKVLDLACGQGAFTRVLHEAGCDVLGVDSAAPLLEKARTYGPPELRYERHDARDLALIRDNEFDLITCVLAMQNISPMRDIVRTAARVLKPGGRFAFVLNHPAFRGPKETSWGWDHTQRIQYRRVDQYLRPRKVPITTHPGKPEKGYTWSYHHPIGDYVYEMTQAGLMTIAIDEWISHKTSQPGPKMKAENRARDEIPLFMAMVGKKVSG